MDDERVLTVLVQVAEQMGFLTPMGPAAPLPPDADGVVMLVAFSGPYAGTVAVGASRALAEALARNLLAMDPTAPVAPSDASDAMAELANVSAGNLLPVLYGDGEYILKSPCTGAWPVAATMTAFLDCAEGTVALAVA